MPQQPPTTYRPLTIDDWNAATPDPTPGTTGTTGSPGSTPFRGGVQAADLIQPPPALPPGAPRINLTSGVPGFIKTGFELGGAMLGPELLGARALAALPTAVRIGTRMLAAGTGAMAGNVVGNTIAQPPPAKPGTPGAPSAAPRTLPGLIKEAGSAFESGMVGEGVGAGITAAGKVVGNVTRLRAPFAKKMTPVGKETAEYLEGQVTPGQVVDSQLLKVTDNIMAGSLFGGGRYRAFIQNQAALLQRKADEILGQFGGRTTHEGAGNLYQEAQEAAHKTAKDAASQLYDDVDQLGQGVTVSLDSLKNFALEDLERRGALGASLRSGTGVGALGKVKKATEVAAEEGVPTEMGQVTSEMAAGNPVLQQILDAFTEAGVSPEAADAGQVTFRQAHEIRSALQKIWRTAERANDGTTRGIASQLLKRIDTAMTEAAQTTPGLRDAYDAATRSWKAMTQTFEQGTLAKAAKAAPADVARTIIKPGRVEDILRARRAVGVDGWKPIQSAYAEQLLTAKDGRLITGKQLTSRLTALRPETLDAVFPRGTSDQIRQLARVMDQVQRTGPGSLKMWIQLAQGGAVAGAATGTLTTKALSILGIPSVLARVTLSPTGRQYLTLGLKASQSGDTVAAARLAGQMTSFLVKEGLLDALDSEGPPSQPSPRPSGPPGSPGVIGQGGRAGGPGPLAAPPPGPPMGARQLVSSHR